jgi:para-aminobenzoate synthetase component I
MTAAAALPADPIAACARLRRCRGRVLLHSGRNDDGLGGCSFVAAEPVATLIARGTSLVLLDRQGRPMRRWSGDPIAAIEDFLVEHGAALTAAPIASSLAFDAAASSSPASSSTDPARSHPSSPTVVTAGHPRVIGYLGYDLGRSIERLGRGPAPGDDCPDVWLGAYDAIVRYPDASADGTVAPPQLLGEPDACARLAARLASASGNGADSPGLPPSLGPLTADDTPDHHRARVERILEYITAGDVYQVNLARRHVAAVRAPGDALALYRTLAAATPAPYGALIEADGVTLLSSSPERFLRVQGDRIETRPIKGTRPRVDDPAANRAAAAELAVAEKDSAEHLMIVDLERNDLGRVAEVGSVTVDDLGYVVDFATVLHRVSRISARLLPSTGHAALLRATFPGGSITGAPKLRAMQLIDELEPARRGPYCGAFGYFGAGTLDLAIAIRVGVLTSRELRIHVGGGIVADSSPAAELAETEDKLAGWRRTLERVEAEAGANAARLVDAER